MAYPWHSRILMEVSDDMPYPAPFHRLVLIGKLYADTFNTTMSIVRVPGSGSLDLPLPDDIAPTIGGIVSSWWGQQSGSNSPFITREAILTSIKLNQIGEDGRYTRPETTEYVLPAQTPGGGSFSPPAQLATVVTLRTAVERGLASKGRMFLPCTDGYHTVQTDGRATAQAAQSIAHAVGVLFQQINTAYAAAQSGDEYLGRVGVASNNGSGQTRIVTRVSAGRVTDTIRSRRNKQQEAPEEYVLA